MPGNVMEGGALGGKCDLEPKGSAFFWASSPWPTHLSPITSVVLC